jgi:hypothetical protein
MNQTHTPLIPQDSVILSGVNASRRNIHAVEGSYSLLAVCRAVVSLLVAVTMLSSSPLSPPPTLTGTVQNSTTGKPAAGDEVVLLSLGQGMEDAGRTKADSKGNFSFKLDAQGPHLVRAIHQGVTYHRMAPPGTTSVEVEVYDVGKQVEGIEVVADIMRFQAGQNQLDVQRIFAVQNTSKPPRTQMNERNLEFSIPEARRSSRLGHDANGNPLNSMPVPEDDKKTRYSFLFLAPGNTQFEWSTSFATAKPILIQEPLSAATLQPSFPRACSSAASGTNYQQMPDPQQPDANVQVASGAQTGQALAFQISGEGTGSSSGKCRGARRRRRWRRRWRWRSERQPARRRTAPIDARPAAKISLVDSRRICRCLVIGVSWSPRASSRQPRLRAGAGLCKSVRRAEVPAPPHARLVSPRRSARPAPIGTPAAQSSKLLEGLKEELFELEVRHGRVSLVSRSTKNESRPRSDCSALKRKPSEPNVAPPSRVVVAAATW